MASIQKRPNGMWRARYRDRAGKEHARHFERKVDAQRWLDEVTTSLVTGMYVSPQAGRITFRAWFEEWADRQSWAPNTRTAAFESLNSVTFADIPLGALRTSDVEGWISAMRTSSKRKPNGLAPTTISNRLAFVSMALRAAVRDKRIAVDPSAGVKAPKARRADKAMTIPTVDEMRRLLDAAAPDFRPFVMVCAFAGLRLGEAAGLQVGDVDFLRRTIEVRRQIQGGAVGSTRVCPPKAGSERTVFVPAALTDALAAHVQEFGYLGEDRWLFSREGHVHHRKSAGRLWVETRERAGLSDFTLHDCRHYFASGLIAAGCDVVTVQRALGHATPSITLNVYAHRWPTAEDKTRAAAADLMAAVHGPRADSLRTEGV